VELGASVTETSPIAGPQLLLLVGSAVKVRVEVVVPWAAVNEYVSDFHPISL
jgi:hypothetical protein